MMISKRALWIGGLTTVAVLAVGGLALASTKSSPQGQVPNPNPNPPPSPNPAPVDCSNATPDSSNPDANAIASSIVFHDSPVPWNEGGSYTQVVNGVTYQFRMERDGDTKIVAVLRCG